VHHGIKSMLESMLPTTPMLDNRGWGQPHDSSCRVSGHPDGSHLFQVAASSATFNPFPLRVSAALP
jgi:hypothetical protein